MAFDGLVLIRGFCSILKEDGRPLKIAKGIGRLVVLLMLLILFLSVVSVRIDLLEETIKGRMHDEKQADQVTIRRSEERVLVVGLVASLQELKQGETRHAQGTVLQSIAQLCAMVHVDLNILYRGPGKASLANEGDTLSEKTVRTILEVGGCSFSLLTEDEVLQSAAYQTLSAMSRYKRLATLRSSQRSWILNRHHQQQHEEYDAVMVVDFDVLALPSTALLRDSIAYVSESPRGNVLCANGMEQWNLFPFNWFPKFRFYLFYDTLAAIDEMGRWYYDTYTRNVFHSLTLAQATLFQQILFQDKHKLWPMQSCFGGLAIYDFKTWSHSECDYDASQILLPRMEKEEIFTRNQSKTRHFDTRQETSYPTTWQLSPNYTLNGSVGGDACEHVTFHQCLRAASKDEPYPLEIGIHTMVVAREPNPLLVGMVRILILGVLLLVGGVLWVWTRALQ